MNERNRTSSDSRTRQRAPQNVRVRRAPQGQAAVLFQSPMMILIVLFGLAFFLIMTLKGCAAKRNGGTDASTPASQVETGGQTSDTSAPVKTSEPSEHTAEATTEAVTTEPVTTEAPTTEPPGPVMTTVDDSYFSDALFLGDSRTDGLFLYSTPGDCKHYPFPATSMTIYSILDSKDENKRYGFATTRDLLKGMQFGKIYLMFGINEVGYSTASFAEKYKEVLDEIRLYQPDALIYIQSILYVTQNHELKYPVFATANIKEKNQAIQVLANDVDTFYLEVNDCLNDGTDHLPSDYTGDGAHLKASKYALWHDYLLQHAYVDDKHPWSPDAPTPEGAQIEHP